MFISGIADEAGQDLATQIRAHRELGWKFVELRTIEGVGVADLSDEEFDNVATQLQDGGLNVSCFAAQLANWARPIDTDFEVDVAELQRAIPRMQRLGTRFIRCMSYPNCDPPLEDAEWRGRALERMRKLAQLAEEGDVVLVHENCHGWASQGAAQTMDLLETIDSPALQLVFDTGNPICFGDNVWELYRQLRPAIAYVHIKDYQTVEKTADNPEGVVACFPGEGEGYVIDIVKDLLATGYDGGFSIEPHITSVIHLDQTASDPDLGYRTYIDYGRRLAKILDECGTG
jgi:sugar phosphate isomerase/epimerase